MLPDSCHVDTRDSEQYSNNHWFGNETTGENWIKTFQRGTVFPGEKVKVQKKITLIIDDHTYTGLLEEE